MANLLALANLFGKGAAGYLQGQVGARNYQDQQAMLAAEQQRLAASAAEQKRQFDVEQARLTDQFNRNMQPRPRATAPADRIASVRGMLKVLDPSGTIQVGDDAFADDVDGLYDRLLPMYTKKQMDDAAAKAAGSVITKALMERNTQAPDMTGRGVADNLAAMETANPMPQGEPIGPPPPAMPTLDAYHTARRDRLLGEVPQLQSALSAGGQAGGAQLTDRLGVVTKALAEYGVNPQGQPLFPPSAALGTPPPMPADGPPAGSVGPQLDASADIGGPPPITQELLARLTANLDPAAAQRVYAALGPIAAANDQMVTVPEYYTVDPQTGRPIPSTETEQIPRKDYARVDADRRKNAFTYTNTNLGPKADASIRESGSRTSLNEAKVADLSWHQGYMDRKLAQDLDIARMVGAQRMAAINTRARSQRARYSSASSVNDMIKMQREDRAAGKYDLAAAKAYMEALDDKFNRLRDRYYPEDAFGIRKLAPGNKDNATVQAEVFTPLKQQMEAAANAYEQLSAQEAGMAEAPAASPAPTIVVQPSNPIFPAPSPGVDVLPPWRGKRPFEPNYDQAPPSVFPGGVYPDSDPAPANPPANPPKKSAVSNAVRDFVIPSAGQKWPPKGGINIAAQLNAIASKAGAPPSQVYSGAASVLRSLQKNNPTLSIGAAYAEVLKAARAYYKMK